MACLSVACLCAAWSAAHARQRADDAVLQPRARVVHAGADRSTQCSRACSSLRPSATSALRPDLREGRLTRRLAGPRGARRAPAQCAEAHRGTESAARAYERLLATAAPASARRPTHLRCGGGNVGDPVARIVMADLCDVHPFVRTRARRLARCTTCRSARVQTRAKDKIAPVLIRGGVGAYRSKIASDG